MVYRDLKPENILLDSQGHIKLTDFGLSKILENEDDKAYTVCGTPQYLVPEILLRKGYDKTVDWWSLGCVLYEMLYGKLPFKFPRGQKISMNIYNQDVFFDKTISEDSKNFIKELLIVKPESRLSSGIEGGDKIKNHKFFNGVNWDDVQTKKIEPPFIPNLKNEADLKYFDSSFTDESIGSLIGKNSLKEGGFNNEYKGFSYLANSVGKELNAIANEE